jgi:hypothetical protein
MKPSKHAHEGRSSPTWLDEYPNGMQAKATTEDDHPNSFDISELRIEAAS